MLRPSKVHLVPEIAYHISIFKMADSVRLEFRGQVLTKTPK